MTKLRCQSIFSRTGQLDNCHAKIFMTKKFQFQPGRLIIKCCSVLNLNSKSADRIYTNLSFKFSFESKGRESLVSNSKALPDSYNGSALEDIFVNFDIIDPDEFTLENHTLIKVELLHENKLASDVLGATTISMNSLVAVFSTASTVYRDRFILSNVDDLVSCIAVDLEFSYIPTDEGILSLFLNEDVLTSLALSVQDTTIQIIMGKVSKDVESREFCRPNGAQVHLEVTKWNWFQDVTINIRHKRNLIAWSTLSPVEYTNSDREYDVSLQFYSSNNDSLYNGSRVSLGISTLKVTFWQSGVLHAQDLNISSLHNIENTRMSTVQLVFTSQGMMSTPRNEVNIPNHQISSNDNIFSMNVVDHDELTLECFLLDALENKIRSLGTGKLSLLPVYTRGTYNASIPIKHYNEEGTVDNAGSIFLSLKFHGRGQKFPKLSAKSTVTLSDQTLTTNHLVNDYQNDTTSDNGCEIFSDEDIKSTFDLCDLDRNGYIGTAELRHVLICMGELVSEEEIDIMIRMLDKNGDGQIDLHQFSMMGKCTSFGMDGPTLDSPNCNDKVKNDYQDKLKVLSNFVAKFNLDKDKLNDLCESLYQRRNSVYSEVEALEMDQNSRSCAIWRMDYPTLRRLLHLDDISDMRNFFQMLNPDSMKNDIDARDFILGIMSFVPTYSVHERTKIMFDLYDERRTGYIQASDLVSMLAASHLKSRDAVIRKSETVLKVVDSRGTGKLSQKDLQNAATKFPNLLFLKIPKPEVTG